MTKRKTTRKPTTRKTTAKVARKPVKVATNKAVTVAIIINRFDTRCGTCFKPMTNREAKACPHCASVFTHVTTECAVEWMKSTAQALRTDLVYIDFGGLA